MAKCPYCNGPLAGPITPVMRPRHQQIHDLVVAAGPSGIPTVKLLHEVFGEDLIRQPGASIMLRVAIHEINKILIAAELNHRLGGQPHGVYRTWTAKEWEELRAATRR